MANAPETLNGKKKVFEEVFISPFEKDSQKDAYRVLDDIRQAHPASSGWVEFPEKTGVTKLPNGKYRAQRHHAKYE